MASVRRRLLLIAAATLAVGFSHSAIASPRIPEAMSRGHELCAGLLIRTHRHPSENLARGFRTQAMVHVLEDLPALSKLREALLANGGYSSAQIAELLPEDPARRIDAVNAADYFYPSTDAHVQRAAGRVLAEVKERVRAFRVGLGLYDTSVLPALHYPIVIAGAGPLAPFYADVASVVQNTPLGPSTTLVLRDDAAPGPFNLESDLHLLQSGPLRGESGQHFDLPLPSSLVELGILEIPAVWRQGAVHILPLADGRIQVALVDKPNVRVSADTVVMSLGLGESVHVITGSSANVTSISQITADGGTQLRAHLRALKGPATINVVGSGGAVASTLHVLYRVQSELLHENPAFVMTVNLWLNLSPGSLRANADLAAHLAWMRIELLEMSLQPANPELVLGSDAVEAGAFEIRHVNGHGGALHGRLFHYDRRELEPFIDATGGFALRGIQSPENLFFSAANALAINSAGQAQPLAALELRNFLDEATRLGLPQNLVLLGDDEGVHTLMIELGREQVTSRLLIGTTQSIGILRAWRQDPTLKPDTTLKIEEALTAVQAGHTQASRFRSANAFYDVHTNADGESQIVGRVSYDAPPGSATFSTKLAMPGAVGVSHGREVRKLP